MLSLGFRISLFVLMMISYITFLIALVERFGVLPSSDVSTSKSNQLSSIPSSSPEKSYIPPILQEPLDILPYQNVLSPSSSAEGIEICAADEDCYTYYPGITSKRPSSLGNLEPAMTRSTGYVIRSVSHWAWGVLRRGVRPRGTRRMQRRNSLRSVKAKWRKWFWSNRLYSLRLETYNIEYLVLSLLVKVIFRVLLLSFSWVLIFCSTWSSGIVRGKTSNNPLYCYIVFVHASWVIVLLRSSMKWYPSVCSPSDLHLFWLLIRI